LERFGLPESLSRVVRGLLKLVKVWIRALILISKVLIPIASLVEITLVLLKITLLSESSLILSWILVVILIPSVWRILLNLNRRRNMRWPLHIRTPVRPLVWLTRPLLECKPVRLPLKYLLEL
jgi:hypothetical protein